MFRLIIKAGSRDGAVTLARSHGVTVEDVEQMPAHTDVFALDVSGYGEELYEWAAEEGSALVHVTPVEKGGRLVDVRNEEGWKEAMS